MWRQNKNKFNAKWTEYNGEKYHSKFEAHYARELDYRLRAGDIKSWRRQIKIPLVVNGSTVCSYVADFEITHNDGSLEIIETKGCWTDIAKLKWKILLVTYGAEHPDVKLTIVKK